MTDDSASRKAFEEWAESPQGNYTYARGAWQAGVKYARTAALAESAKALEEAERLLTRALDLAEKGRSISIVQELGPEITAALAAIRAGRKGERL